MGTDVIVVGAGPVGLMLAGELRLGGVDVAIYDKLGAPSGESRGLGFTTRTAEVLDQRGLLDRLGDIRWGKQGHFGGVRIDFSMLAESHFGVMGLAQSVTESMLDGWLAELGTSVRRGYELTGLREDADGIVATFAGPDGEAEERARYLVGCDGGNSTVRRLAGIDFPGTAATRGMYLADIAGAGLRMRPIGERISGGGMVLSVTLREGVDRIVIHEPGLRPRSEDGPTFTEIADAWQRMTGESIHHAQPLWMAALTNATGLAAKYRTGRVFLAGDAAHNHAPLAAQGISVGLQDAVNLGWKLAMAVRGEAPDSLLDSYHAERHPVGQQLLRDVQAQSLLYLSGDEMEPLRSVMRELVAYPDVAEHLAGLISGLSIRYDMGVPGHPLLGLRMRPDRELELTDGGRARVAELLHPGRGLLITTGDARDLASIAVGWAGRVDLVTGSWAERRDGDQYGPDAVLVRPDGYVAWAAPGSGDLAAALGRWFGSARAVAAA